MKDKKKKPTIKRIQVIDRMEIDHITFGDRFFAEGAPIKVGGRILESHYEDIEIPEENRL